MLRASAFVILVVTLAASWGRVIIDLIMYKILLFHVIITTQKRIKISLIKLYFFLKIDAPYIPV
ncbi:hypothetical protein BXP70_24555 [Hymenobacter crusticola]|uniref:Uncharacterized protein n=1 Tax=Hymenobacter crusticola TaxID=1770526 RepID=A0A243W7H4_9BACT|nr:hypothetical protein BXP70_24555 [Hymenobacter crusticola]